MIKYYEKVAGMDESKPPTPSEMLESKILAHLSSWNAALAETTERYPRTHAHTWVSGYVHGLEQALEWNRAVSPNNAECKSHELEPQKKLP